MPVDLVEFARLSIAALNARDLDAFCRLCHPDVEVVSQLSELEGGAYRGYDGVARWFANVDSLGFIRQTADELEELDDDRMFMLGTSWFRGPASGVELENRWGAVVELRDGRLTRLRVYGDVGRARADAGLSPA